ncbi:cellulose-binding protein [Exilibacterium tricleocarpae]|uniref:Glycine cleavage system transcriptional repressor n=2 Tax=Exilibacterium tricleocarpae TaxID=2591008 RepID=A0A545SS88_9GAMM|nr:cellulose-binding protein [Exilibacterium tricleocarpae]
MTKDLVLTVISDDKPGVVETLAQTIAAHGGNWSESQLSHLAGKFAGILRVSASEENVAQLRRALDDLQTQSIKVVAEPAGTSAGRPPCRHYTFTALGNDRPGIVREIAQALSSRQINMEHLSTEYSSMPWSGEPLFSATGSLQVPTSVDIDDLTEQLDTIADELAIDIALEEPQHAQEPSREHN